MANIKKIKLSNGQVYSIFDEGALRLGTVEGRENVLLTGNAVVDEVILEGNLFITEIDDMPLESIPNNVLVQNTATGEVVKRSTDYLLEDIGGISTSGVSSEGILSFKLGK